MPPVFFSLSESLHFSLVCFEHSFGSFGYLCFAHAQDYLRLLKFGDSQYRCKELKRAALGRMATVLKKLNASLGYLEQVLFLSLHVVWFVVGSLHECLVLSRTFLPRFFVVWTEAQTQRTPCLS